MSKMCTAPHKGHVPGSLNEKNCPEHGRRRKGHISNKSWVMGDLQESLRTGELPVLDYDRPESLREMSQFVFDKLVSKGENPVLVTVHGSWLYGTANENSDIDLYAVVNNTSKTNKQKVVGDLDVAQIGLKTFVKNVSEGTHQAVEALWSPVSVRDESFGPYLGALRVNPYRFEARARRAQESYDKLLEESKAARAQRRFEAEVQSVREYGSFNPLTVSPDSVFY